MLPELVDADTYTYALIDYRGYGARKDEAGEYTLEEISADTLALADELGWDRFALVGHSMGGAAALRVLADARSVSPRSSASVRCPRRASRSTPTARRCSRVPRTRTATATRSSTSRPVTGSRPRG